MSLGEQLAVLVTDVSGKINFVSPSVSAYGYTVEKFLGKGAKDYVHPMDKALLIQAERKLLHAGESEVVLQGIQYVVSGAYQKVNLRLTRLINQQGHGGILYAIYQMPEGSPVVNQEDKNEDKFKNIFNTSHDAILITDMDGNYLEVNAQGVRRFGFSKQDLLDMNFYELKQHSKKNKVQNYVKTIQTQGFTSQEFLICDKYGEVIKTEIYGSLINFGGTRAMLHVSRDITQRKKHEQEVIQANIMGEEKERKRLARDLHDGVGPYLSAMKFMLLSLEDALEPLERKRIISKVNKTLDSAINNIKQASNNLSPCSLEYFGIVSSLNAFLVNLPDTGTEFVLHSNLKGKRFSDELELALFRVVIELINNTLKYAGAKHAQIELQLKDNQLHFSYKHDGAGFDFEETLQQKKGSGLLNIMNRVYALDGTCSFKTAPKENFHFEGRFALKQSTKNKSYA